MAMSPEGKVKHQIIKLLEAYHVHRPSVWMTKQRDQPINGLYHVPVSTGMGESGVPDFICTVGGRALFIEAKATAKKKPTPYQQRFIDGIRAAGGLALVIHDENTGLLETILKELIHGNRRR